MQNQFEQLRLQNRKVPRHNVKNCRPKPAQWSVDKETDSGSGTASTRFRGSTQRILEKTNLDGWEILSDLSQNGSVTPQRLHPTLPRIVSNSVFKQLWTYV